MSLCRTIDANESLTNSQLSETVFFLHHPAPSSATRPRGVEVKNNSVV